MIFSHADHAATLSHADLADFTDRLITRIADHAATLSHADLADFTDMLIQQIGCLMQIVFNLQDRTI